MKSGSTPLVGACYHALWNRNPLSERGNEADFDEPVEALLHASLTTVVTTTPMDATRPRQTQQQIF
jgi:hypothetical protein